MQESLYQSPNYPVSLFVLVRNQPSVNPVNGLAHMTCVKCTVTSPWILRYPISMPLYTVNTWRSLQKKSFVVSECDKPWISLAIKSLIKERSRLYSCGDITNGKKLRNQIVSLAKKAKAHYGRETMPCQLLASDPKKWHNAVKKLAGQAFDSSVKISNDDGTLISAEEVTEFFTKICTIYPPPITADEKSTILEKCDSENNIIVSEFDVYTELRKIKPNTSSYPCEWPAKLLSEYAAFIALPLSSIINEC